MRKDERGMIVVETIGSFMLFFLLMMSILSLINIVTVQARIHYAMTQTANTVSMYSYVLEVTGIADTLMKISEKSDEVDGDAEAISKEINNIVNALSDFSIEEVEESLDRTGAVSQTYFDPKIILQALLNTGLDEGQKQLFEMAIRPMMNKFLANGHMSGDEYLKSANVIGGLDGLDFADFDILGNSDSRLVDENGDLKITVKYDVEYKFGGLPLPFEPKLGISQVVKTKLWLSGSGEGHPYKE